MPAVRASVEANCDSLGSGSGPPPRSGSAAQLDLNENRERLVFALRFFERQHEAVTKISLFVDVEVPFIFRPAKHRPFFCQLEP
jgi:hypothetical protein